MTHQFSTLSAAGSRRTAVAASTRRLMRYRQWVHAPDCAALNRETVLHLVYVCNAVQKLTRPTAASPRVSLLGCLQNVLMMLLAHANEM